MDKERYVSDALLLLKVQGVLNKLKGLFQKHKILSLEIFENVEECKDLCAFNIIQLQALKDDISIESCNSVSCLNDTLTELRDMIVFNYQLVSAKQLYDYIVLCISDENATSLQNRSVYCSQYYSDSYSEEDSDPDSDSD